MSGLKGGLGFTIVIASLVSLALAAAAQLDQLKSMTPAERAKLQTDMMVAKLGLSPDQTSKVAAINQKYAQQMQPIITGSEGPFMKLRQMRGIGEAKEAELKGILSPDQFQKYLAERADMRERFEERLVQ